MEKLKQLIELCKQRQKIFAPNSQGNGDLFSPYVMDEAYQKLTKQINSFAKDLKIYSISFYDQELVVAFDSLSAMKKVTGDEHISKAFSEAIEEYRYSVSLFDGDLTLLCFEKYSTDEEHKKAQAI